jgi:hypothetical protein
MPEISRFYGIIIKMNFDDHNPLHFHAEYGDFKAVIRIDGYSVLKSDLPPRALGLVVEWASLRNDELLHDWNLSEGRAPLGEISPLE